jgi:hypothetical protein
VGELISQSLEWVSYNPLSYLTRTTFHQLIGDWMGGTLAASLNTLTDNLIQRTPLTDNRALPCLSEQQQQVDDWEAEFVKETSAATKAKIALTMDKDAGQACKKAGESHLLLQSQALVAKLDDTQEVRMMDSETAK